jgi:N-sulfoglucosamine sulfohydrolase
MRAAAESVPQIAERVELFLYRTPEECYDFQRDPDALSNLIGNPAYEVEVQRLRSELETWMERTGDPALGAFRSRASQEALEAFVQQTAIALGGE